MATEERTPLRAHRRGFTFEWWGGEYVEICRAFDPQPFEVINMSPAEGNGHLPPFTREVFLSALDDLDSNYYRELRCNYREQSIGKVK